MVPLAIAAQMYILPVYTERVMKTTKTFKSGNSVAVRLPKALGVKAGTEMRVREEQGRYIFEPVPVEPTKIDLTGIYGSIPGLKPRTRAERDFDESPRDWDKLFKRD
jgi:antitoxin VapB